MSSSLRRGALAAAAIAVSIASLAACGAGHNAETLEIRPDNAATSVGDIKVQNAFVATQPGKEATGPAAVSATLFNGGRSAETLESITVEGVGEVKLTPAKGKSLSVPAGGSLVIGGKDNASAVLAGGEGLGDGDAQKVTFTFSRTGGVTLRALVVPSEGYYASWGPTGAPAAPGASASASEQPGEDASGEPSGEASASGEASEGAAATPSDAASASASASASEDHASAGH